MATGEDLEWAEFWTDLYRNPPGSQSVPKPRKRKKK